jgi:GTP-binding protein
LVNHFLINDSWYLVDLPGYGYAKMSLEGRKKLASIIRDYLSNSEELVLLFVLVDSRHDIGKIDLDFINELGENEVPFAVIFTKCDKIGPNVLKAQVEKDKEILSETWEELPETFTSSANSKLGREEILGYIEGILSKIKHQI